MKRMKTIIDTSVGDLIDEAFDIYMKSGLYPKEFIGYINTMFEVFMDE